jgi:hypothetical protein
MHYLVLGIEIKRVYYAMVLIHSYYYVTVLISFGEFLKLGQDENPTCSSQNRFGFAPKQTLSFPYCGRIVWPFQRDPLDRAIRLPFARANFQ